MNFRSEGKNQGLARCSRPTEGKDSAESKDGYQGFPAEMAQREQNSPIGPSPQTAKRSMQGPDFSPHLADWPRRFTQEDIAPPRDKGGAAT